MVVGFYLPGWPPGFVGTAVDVEMMLTPLSSCCVSAFDSVVAFLAIASLPVEFLLRQKLDVNGMAGILKLTCRFPIAFWMLCRIPLNCKSQKGINKGIFLKWQQGQTFWTNGSTFREIEFNLLVFIHCRFQSLRYTSFIVQKKSRLYSKWMMWTTFTFRSRWNESDKHRQDEHTHFHQFNLNDEIKKIE